MVIWIFGKVVFNIIKYFVFDVDVGKGVVYYDFVVIMV